MTVAITPLTPDDRAPWDGLARCYKAFYETAVTDAELDTAWARLLRGDGVHGLAAWRAGALVGITHYLFHTSVWSPRVCYLQDLYVDEAHRGQGAARALIDAVGAAAREAGAQRLYWLTQAHNHTARSLYDKVARHQGFIRYDYPL